MLHHKDRARLLNAYSSFSIHIILLCRDVHRYGGHVRILYIIRIIGGHFLLSRHLHLFSGFPPPAVKSAGYVHIPCSCHSQAMPLLPVLHHGPLFLHVLDDRRCRGTPFPYPALPGFRDFRLHYGRNRVRQWFLIPQEHVMHAMTAINKYPNVFIFFNFMFFILSPLSRRIPV